MTCETIRSHLVAYRDGELPEPDRAHVAAHLSTCPVCTREDAQLAGVHQLLTNLERITPSPDSADTASLSGGCHPCSVGREAGVFCELSGYCRPGQAESLRRDCGRSTPR